MPFLFRRVSHCTSHVHVPRHQQRADTFGAGSSKGSSERRVRRRVPLVPNANLCSPWRPFPTGGQYQCGPIEVHACAHHGALSPQLGNTNVDRPVANLPSRLVGGTFLPSRHHHEQHGILIIVIILISPRSNSPHALAARCHGRIVEKKYARGSHPAPPVSSPPPLTRRQPTVAASPAATSARPFA